MFKKLQNLDPLIHYFLFLCVIILSVVSLFLYNQINTLSSNKINSQIVEKNEATNEIEEADSEKLKKLISDIVAELLPTPATTTNTKEIVKKEATTTSPRTSFISMGSTTTTAKTDWVDVADSEVYIDLKNDFGKNAYVTFESSLKVAHANGQAYVRLYDSTNKIAVVGSELSTSNNADYKQVISSKLNLWSGKNTYKVQIKSLNGFDVTYSNGKIKVVY